MIRNFKKSITYKIFLITTALLCISALLIYLIFYFLLPSYYYKYKTDTLNEEINELVQTVDSLPFYQAKEILDEFNYNNNASIVIHDSHGNIIYIPPVPARIVQKITMTDDQLSIKQNTSVYTLEKNINFLDGSYIATVYATLQPIDEASDVIFKLMPYIALIVLLISLVGAFLYAKLITNPLLKINHVAKRMAELDFTHRCKTDSKDEIGELSNSLNELSSNLEKTMFDLQKANEQLKDDIQKERELEVKRREFLATISHELKSPITAVMGQLEAMIYRIGVYKDRDKYLKRSFSIMQNMQRLVNEILEISKLETYDFLPQLQRINLSQLLQSILNNHEYFSREKQLEMKKEIEPDLYIRADKDLLQKALSNIVNNAIKYSKDKEQVITKLSHDNHIIILKVLNTGAHIGEAELTKIFQPFYRIEKSRSRSTGGSGLGLFIVKRVMEIHGVDYALTNTEDGVQFTMKFNKEA
ncbi:sensor histidine kinase [Thermoflavimicrobium daqui]|uniref:histidine kinase n=1 Tax=Thermoflavimicrobium daqui TaxID=2137476 RepID=A0A364K467_9BACL|nr:HAMP domain-containing sensor histidine kinase [Thermoflavimicrobium daqui]RAL24152.1 two-component sensor histidine kinase [Thermoflavimicrobium daqui]